jgi:hypothetical protein
MSVLHQMPQFAAGQLRPDYSHERMFIFADHNTDRIG